MTMPPEIRRIRVNSAYKLIAGALHRLRALGEPDDEIRGRIDEIFADQAEADREPEAPPAPDPDSTHDRNR